MVRIFRFIDAFSVNSMGVLYGLVVVYEGTSSFLISMAVLLR